MFYLQLQDQGPAGVGGNQGPGGAFQSSSTSQQSRLNQWKLPSIDKDNSAGGNDGSTDFSRAPGTTAKSTMSTSNSSMGSLGLQSDGFV